MKKKIITLTSITLLTISCIKTKAQTGITYDAGNNQAKITTNFGNLWMGPSGISSNYGWCHIKTDASMFFMDKTVTSATGIFGAYNNTNLVFQTNANPNTSVGFNVTRMTILKSNGNVGIGTSSPKSLLDVIGNTRIGAEGASDATSDPNTALTLYASNIPNALKIKTWNNGLKVISIDNVNFTTSPFTVLGNGAVKINTDDINALEIKSATTNTVNFLVKNTGVVYAREINVQLTAFPDYVFANNYKLTPLSEVEKYINTNKHLKGFEPAKIYESNGMNVGEVIRMQQEKIEELTLYIIELDKKIKELQKK